MAKQSVGVGLGVPRGVNTRRVSNKYAVGDDGHVYCWSTARVNAKKPQPFRLAEAVSSRGYLFVSLVLDGKKQSRPVHTMVCAAFHGPKPTSSHEVRHLDGDRRNNRPDNLRWGTRSENEADKRRHGTVAEGERHGNAALTEDAVRIIRASIPYGLWDTDNAAKVFGVTPGHVAAIARGQHWKHVT